MMPDAVDEINNRLDGGRETHVARPSKERARLGDIDWVVQVDRKLVARAMRVYTKLSADA